MLHSEPARPLLPLPPPHSCTHHCHHHLLRAHLLLPIAQPLHRAPFTPLLPLNHPPIPNKQCTLPWQAVTLAPVDVYVNATAPGRPRPPPPGPLPAAADGGSGNSTDLVGEVTVLLQVRQLACCAM